MRRAAFTLIEILVVIGIIALIAAITFGVLSSARAGGRTTKCISNMHQWGAALQMYRQDWDGIDPEPGLKLTSLYQLGLPPRKAAGQFLKMYHLDNPAVFYCPDARQIGMHAKQGYRELCYADDDTKPYVLDALFRRGGEVPLLACLYHNPHPIEADNPTYGTLKVIALRFNQQVNVRTIRAWGVGSRDW